MTIQAGGDSGYETNDQLAGAFGFTSGEATESNSDEPVGTPSTEEDTTQENEAEASETKVSEESDVERDASEEEMSKEEKRRLEEAHVLIVNTIEDRFKDLDKGQLTAEELKEWFDQNPEFADIANRSKRMKERYRSFTETVSELPAKTDEKDEKEKPLTLKDLVEYDRQREAQLLKKQYEQASQKALESFVTSKGVSLENAPKLKTIADSLVAANEDWTFEDALQAAHRALYPSKGAPVNIAGSGVGSTPPASAAPETPDFSSWNEVVSLEDFTR